jgi:hypothetical protein
MRRIVRALIRSLVRLRRRPLGGAAHASATPAGIARNGTNQEREVNRPTITASADHLEDHYAEIADAQARDSARYNTFDPWRYGDRA